MYHFTPITPFNNTRMRRMNITVPTDENEWQQENIKGMRCGNPPSSSAVYRFMHDRRKEKWVLQRMYKYLTLLFPLPIRSSKRSNQESRFPPFSFLFAMAVVLDTWRYPSFTCKVAPASHTRSLEAMIREHSSPGYRRSRPRRSGAIEQRRCHWRAQLCWQGCASQRQQS